MRRFISSYIGIECDTRLPEYWKVRNLAYALMVIWPVGMPLAFLLALLPIRTLLREERSSRLTRATAFLHRDYKPSLFFWEPLVLIQRIAVTGWEPCGQNHDAQLEAWPSP